MQLQLVASSNILSDMHKETVTDNKLLYKYLTYFCNALLSGMFKLCVHYSLGWIAQSSSRIPLGIVEA